MVKKRLALVTLYISYVFAAMYALNAFDGNTIQCIINSIELFYCISTLYSVIFLKTDKMEVI